MNATLIVSIVAIVAVVAMLVVLNRRLADMREIMLQSEDTVNRIAEKFEAVDDVQFERQWHEDDRRRGRWN